jgi:zinc protease
MFRGMNRLLLLLALLSVPGCGPSARDAAKASADAIFPYPYTIDDFDNGLRLVTVSTEYPDVVALYIVSHVGSRNEVEPGRSGFAHLFEHMMFRGTEKYPAEKWQAIMERAGAETNAYTTDDRTVYHAVFSKEDLETIVELEADRFQNLKYTEEQFRTETRAVLGEYNKNFASPQRKLDEIVREAAFKTHTYAHTTMGFEKDVENMPTMYEYGLQFFDRYYRPEYTTICIVGDADPKTARALVEKYWGGWKRGTHKAAIPSEPPQGGAKNVDHTFHTPTLPIVSIAFHAPAYDDEVNDTAVLDAISFHSFSPNSPLYKRLVVEEQKVEDLSAGLYDHVDPYLFEATATVKDVGDVDYVRTQVLGVFEQLKTNPIPAAELDAVKSHLRYQFALSMDSTSSIAETLAHYIGLRRTPETINKRYALYQNVTPDDVQRVARKYFVESERSIATLTSAPEPGKASAR